MLKRITLFTFFFLILTTIAACAPGPAPAASTPTPLPPFAGDPEREKSDTNSDAPPESPATVEEPALVREAVVEALDMRIDSFYPVEGQVRARGFLKDGCTEISGWEQTLYNDTLHIRPGVTAKTGGDCSKSEVQFEEMIDIDVHGLALEEIATGDYGLDVNGQYMNLSMIVASSWAGSEDNPANSE